MESKTKTPDLTVRASFALIQGAVLAMTLPLCFFLFPGYVQGSLGLFLFVAVPIISFLSSLFINVFLQYLYCKSVNINTVTLGASLSSAFAVGLGGLSYLLPFLRNPIGQLFSDTPQIGQDGLDTSSLMKDIWGYSFYLFWAGVYGQTLGAGMISTCA